MRIIFDFAVIGLVFFLLGCVKFEGIHDYNKQWLPPEINDAIEIGRISYQGAGNGGELLCLLSFKKEVNLDEHLNQYGFVESDKSDVEFMLKLSNIAFPKELNIDPDFYRVFRSGNGHIDVYLLLSIDERKGFIYYLFH